MIDTKQNRDVIIVYCDQCANSYRVLTSIVEDCELTLTDMIEAIDWRIEDKAFGIRDGHTCSSCVRKGR